MPSPAERASSTICPARVSTVHLGPAATFILYRDELPELLFGPGFGAEGQPQPVFGLGAFGQCPRGDPLPAGALPGQVRRREAAGDRRGAGVGLGGPLLRGHGLPPVERLPDGIMVGVKVSLMSNPDPGPGGALLGIGELAQLTGKRPSAIRYYEQIGLLPQPARMDGRRRYHHSIVRTLAVIDTGQAWRSRRSRRC